MTNPFILWMGKLRHRMAKVPFQDHTHSKFMTESGHESMCAFGPGLGLSVLDPWPC